MRYTVNTISKQSGLSLQTVRSYADDGMLPCMVDEQNSYRYFDADAVNRIGAVRSLSLCGFSREEIRRLIYAVPPEEYDALMRSRLEAHEQELRRHMEIIDILKAERRGFAQASTIGEDEMLLQEAGPFFCLDYRKNNELILSGKEDQALLQAWMEQALYTRNYTPCPDLLAEQQMRDHVISLLADARYAEYLPTGAPVYRRERSLCACFSFRHDKQMHPLPRPASFYLDRLHSEGLSVCGEPFISGFLPVRINGEKEFVTMLYIPVQKIAAGE